MMKYIDLVAYPLALVVVYVLFGFINWERDPNLWSYIDRCLWLVWGLMWGWALQLRINRGGKAWTLT